MSDQRRDRKGQFAAGGLGVLAAGGAGHQGLGAKANTAESLRNAKEADLYHKLGNAYRNFSESAAADPDPQVQGRASFYEGSSMNYKGTGDWHERWANYHARSARKNKLAAGVLGATALGAGAEAVRRRNKVEKSVTTPPTRTKRERLVDTLASTKITPDQSKKAAVGGQIGGSVGALTGTALGASIGVGTALASRGKATRALRTAEATGKGAKKAKRALDSIKVGERAKTGAFLGAGSGTALGGGGGAAAGLIAGRPNRKKQTVAKRRKNQFDVYFRNPDNRYVDYRSKVANADKIRFVEDYGSKDDTSVVIGNSKMNLGSARQGGMAKAPRGKIRKSEDFLGGTVRGPAAAGQETDQTASVAKAFDENQHRRGQGGKFAQKTGMTEAPGSRSPSRNPYKRVSALEQRVGRMDGKEAPRQRVSDDAQAKLARGGLVGAQIADAAAVKSAWHESKTAVKEGTGVKSALKYGSKKAAFPVVAGGLAATLLADHVMRNQQKKLKAQSVAKVKPKTVASGFNRVHGAIYSGTALAAGSTLVGPHKMQNRAKLKRAMVMKSADPWDEIFAKAAQYSQKRVDEQKKASQKTMATGAGIVAAGEAGGAAASRGATKAKARSELATRVASSGPNSPWLKNTQRVKAREIAARSGMKATGLKELATGSRAIGRIYGGGALAIGGAGALAAHHHQKQRNAIGKSASSNRAPRYDKKSGRRVRNPGINPTTNQARAQRWTSEGAGAAGAIGGAVGGARAAERGLTHAANKYGAHVTRNFYQGKPVNLSEAEKITRGLHAAARNPKVATGAALAGSAVAGTAAYNATKKTVLGIQRRGTTRKKPVSKGLTMQAPDVDELFAKARNWDEISKWEKETKRGAKTGAKWGAGVVGATSALQGGIAGGVMGGKKGAIGGALTTGALGAGSGALQGGAIGGGVGAIQAHGRKQRQHEMRAARASRS